MDRTIFPMLSKVSGEVEFEVIVYGFHPTQLQQTNHPVVRVLGRKYSNHVSSLFILGHIDDINLGPRAQPRAHKPRYILTDPRHVGGRDTALRGRR